MEIKNTLARLSDDELLRRLSALLRGSRRIEAELIAHIAEVDGRRLYAREAASSMHGYCTEILDLSDAEAFSRITARASRRHPMLLEELAGERTEGGRRRPHTRWDPHSFGRRLRPPRFENLTSHDTVSNNRRPGREVPLDVHRG